jgi:predicted dehydrogenase
MAEALQSVGVGVIGLGFMGRTHCAAYGAARRAGLPVRIAAVSDARGAAARGGTAGNLHAAGPALELDAEVFETVDPVAVFARPDVDLVSICTYTDTHAALAESALRAGKHVLVEKPVALAAADVRRLAEVAQGAGRACMPALCMRFWPGWSWLREQIVGGGLGRVRSAVFRRLAAPPPWSREFYGDPARSGGALHDLHIHDADFVRWCFGEPYAVASTGSRDHLTTLYRYPGGPAHVVAEGGWDHTPGFAFRMAYTVVFEQATAIFDSGAAPQLHLVRDGRSEPVALEAATGWELEIRHLLEVLLGRTPGPAVTLADAEAVARLLACEQRSFECGEAVRVG